MPRPSNPRKPEKLMSLRPVPLDNPALAAQPVPYFTAPKGIDRFNVSSRVDPQHAVKIRNFMFDDSNLVSRLGTDLMGGNAASIVMQVIDLVRKGQKKVTLRFCLRHLEIFEYGLGAWRSFPIPLTGSERDFFAYTGWANKILFSNGVDGLWEFDFTTMEAKIVPGAPGAKHLTTFGSRVVASSTIEDGADFPLRVRWSAKDLYNEWSEGTEDAPVQAALAGGHEDLYGSPGGITDEAMGVFPFGDEQAWLIRSHSTWQMAVSGNALAPFRFNRVIPQVGTAYRNTIVSVDAGVVFASRDNVHYVTQQGHSLIGNLIADEVEEEVENLRTAYAAYDVGRQEYRMAAGSLVWRYRFVEEGWTLDEYPYSIRSLSRQVQGVAGLPIDNLPGIIDGLSAAFPPGAINDLVYDRSSDNAMMFVPESTELTTRENDQPQDTLLTGEETDSEILIETGFVNLDVLKAIELHGIHGEYESEMSQELLFEASFDDGDSWQPLSIVDIEETFGSEMWFIKQERVSRKMRLRLRSLTLGKIRLLGLAPMLVSVERTMASRRPRPATIIVSPSPINLQVGQTQQLSIRVLDANGVEITGQKVTLLSSNTAIATVSGTGLVRAIAPGSFAIVASIKNVQTSDSGTVVPAAVVPVAQVIVMPDVSQGAVGTQQLFTATLLDDSGNVLVGRQVTWASGDPSFATIDANGLATLVSVGTVAISATSEGITGAATLTVTAAADVVDSVEVIPNPFSVTAGQTIQLTALPKDIFGNILSGKTIAWSSDAPSIATVNAAGLVTAVAAGSVTITATCDLVPGTAGGTVIAAPVVVAQVIVSPSSFSKPAGQTQQLTVTVKDGSGNVLVGRTVTWSSGNNSIATVDQTGLVTALAVGTATITASCEGINGTSAATVTPVAVASVTVSPASFSVNTGLTAALVATPKDANGNPLTGRTITWGSSDPTKATVSNTGVVTGVSVGSVTITATCETKFGTSLGTIGAATYSALDSNSGVIYQPEPNPSEAVAELPRVYLDSKYNPGGVPLTFVSTVTLTDAAGNRTQNTTSLQQAIDAAAARSGHSKIRLPSPFPANPIILKKHAFAGSKTYIEAVTAPSAEFVRCSPTVMTNSPNIRCNVAGGNAVSCAAGADNYRLVGLSFDAGPKTSVSIIYDLILIQSGNGTILGDVPTGIWFDRCLVRGGDAGTGIDNGNVRNGVTLHGIGCGIVDSWVDQIGFTGSESHAVISFNSPGPLKIVNNFLEATSINVFLGGAIPPLGATVGRPTDIEIRRNHLFKRMQWAKDNASTWDGVPGRGIKNHFETKNCVRVLFEGNVLENCWADGQAGMSVTIKSGTGNGISAAGCGSEDVTMRHSIIRNSVRAWSFMAHPDEQDAIPAKKCLLYNTLAYNIGTFAGQTQGLAWLMLSNFDDLMLKHNTLVHNEFTSGIYNIELPGSGTVAQRFISTDNLFSTGHPDYGVFMSGGFFGSTALGMWAPGYSWLRNVMIGLTSTAAARHPQGTNQFATDVNAVQFVDAPNKNYALAGGSPYKGDGENGTDPGADITKVNLATSGVVVAAPAPCGIITNSNPITVSSFPKPSYLVAVTEPDFGTKYLRVTDDPGNAIPVAGGTWPTVAGHQYSKKCPWSSDMKYIFLNRDQTADYGGGFAGLVIDAATKAPVVRRNHVGNEAVWHPALADNFICVMPNGSVVFHNPITNAQVTKYSTALYSNAYMGNYEGNPSNTGQFVAVQATRISDSKLVAYVVDTVNGTKSADLDLAAEGVTNLDWVSISQLAGFLVVHGIISGVNQATKVYTFNPSTLAIAFLSFWNTDAFGHFDLGVDTNGTTEVAFGGAANGTHAKKFIKRVLSSGVITDLSPAVSFDWHASCRNINRPGWGYVVTNDNTGSYLDGTIYAVKMDGSQIERWGRHRSLITGTFESQPHASPSPDGKQVFFRSNWGVSTPIHGFVIDVRDICP